jgi:glycosyltransferase involved in cell wall biosynthesis
VTAPLAGRRVLIIVENLPVPFDRRVWLEAKALRDAGCTVTVICPKMKGFTAGFEVLECITIYRHPLPFEGDRGFLGFLAEYGIAFLCELLVAWWVFLTRGFDVIHACNPPDNIFLIGLTFRLFGVQFVYDQHDINPELYEAKYARRDLLYRAICWFERMSYRSAHLVIATNDSYRAIALGRGGKEPGRVHIVRSAPDTEKFRPVEPDPSLKRGRANLVVYLGVMGKQEGVDLLLDAIALIVKDRRRDDVWFALVGSGPARPALESHAARLGIADRLEFTGRISDTDLLSWLSTADVCVNPDRVNEMNDKSTMNKIMEYMAVGKPIVQFETTEGRHSAQDASLYARPNDPADFAVKICRLLDDPAERARMGARGLERMRTTLDWRFSREALVRAYESLWPRG